MCTNLYDVKAAHAAGFRVQFRMSLSTLWRDPDRLLDFSLPADHYRVHPDDALGWCEYKLNRLSESEVQRMPHPHAALIKQWADGAVIQYLAPNREWYTVPNAPTWAVETQYRVKPQETDLQKYGVEVGDVWSPSHSGTDVKLFAARVSRTYPAFYQLNGVLTELDGGDKLLFRRGVVNKL